MRDILLIILLSYSFKGSAQVIEPGNQDSIATKFYSINEVSSDFTVDSANNFIDTSLSELVNLANLKVFHAIDLGTYGSPFYSTLYNNQSSLGLHKGFDRLDYFRYDLTNQNVLLVSKPLTLFTYQKGSFEEEIFNIKHTQSIKNKISLGFEFNSVKAEGDYLSQLNKHQNIVAYLVYNNDSSKYKVSLKFVKNQLLTQNNGGVASDSLYENSQGASPFTPTRLDDALYKSRDKGFSLYQIYQVKPGVRLFHSGLYNFQQNSLRDLEITKGSYEPNWTVNGSELWSRFSTSMLNNEIGINLMDSVNELKYRSEISLNQNLSNIQTYVSDFNLNTSWFNSSIDISRKNFTIRNKFYLGFLGNQQGEFNEEFAIEYSNNKIKIELSDNIQSSSPTVLQSVFYSSGGTWSNEFNYIKSNNIELGIHLVDKFSLKVGSSVTNNIIYFDNTVRPKQLNEDVTVQYANLSGVIRLGSLSWQPFLRYQKVNNGILQLPEFSLFNRLYVEGWIFDHNMNVQLGSDLYFTTAYFTPGFSSVTNQFYYSSENKIGNYPFVDLFFVAKVKATRIFVKANNMYQLISGKSPYTAFLYPHSNFSIKFGFNWVFVR